LSPVEKENLLNWRHYYFIQMLFKETHPQPFGAVLGGQGSVDGKDGG